MSGEHKVDVDGIDYFGLSHEELGEIIRHYLHPEGTAAFLMLMQRVRQLQACADAASDYWTCEVVNGAEIRNALGRALQRLGEGQR